MSTEQKIGFVFCIVASLQLALFWILERKAVYNGLRGKDNVWQAIEVIALTAIIIWPCMLLADAFFGFHASDNAWNSINIVIAVAILGISYKQYLAHQEKKTAPVKPEIPDHEKPEGQ